MGAVSQKFRESPARILLATSERLEARRIIELFDDNGFEAKWVSSIPDVKRQITNWAPKVIVTDLLLSGGSGFDVLDHLVKTQSQKIAVIFVSSHASPENIEEALRRGAKDFLQRPFMHQQLINRVILQCREPLEVEDQIHSGDLYADFETLLNHSMSTDPIELVMHEVTKFAAGTLGGVRCSVIRTITANEGLVFASSDDAKITGLRLDLSQYPEVQLVANTKKMIAINDLSNSRALKHIVHKAKSVQFSAMIVAPVYYKNRLFGVMSMRLPATAGKLSMNDVRFMAIAAKCASLALSSRAVGDLGQFGLISAS